MSKEKKSGKGNQIDSLRYVILLGLIWTAFAAPSASAVEPPFELDPVLSLTGDCSTSVFDPIPDPSCTGEPPVYPLPPNRPKGRFEEPRAIAIDPYGNEYVASWAESVDADGRVDVFDDEGKFVTEVAVPGAKTIAVDSKGNLYVFEDSGKVVRYAPVDTEKDPYEPEAGNIEYIDPAVTISTGSDTGSLTVDAANDELLVARSAITRYSSAEAGNGVIESFEPEGIGAWTEEIAVDAERRRIYVTFCKKELFECGVKVVGADSPHTLLKDLEGPSEEVEFTGTQGRFGIAVDEETGDFFVSDFIPAKLLYQFNEGYELVSQIKSNEFQGNAPTQIAVSNGERSVSAEPCEYPDPKVPAGDACNRHYVFAPAFNTNRAIAFSPPGQLPPVIEGVSTAGIGETEAQLRAVIFPGGLETEYQFELTTQEAFEAEGFEGAAILGTGTIPSDNLATEVKTFATGLLTGGTYRFRVVAENELGPAAEEGQNEAAFTTYDDASSPLACPNEALRVGASAQLPDCRAYELVTPPDTGGRSPKGVGFVGELFTTVETSLAGDAVWFKIEGGSLSDSDGVGSFEGDPYVATRGGSGWSSELAGASGAEATVSIPGSSSPDQGYAFWSARIEGPLLLNGEETQYLYYPDGHSELIGRGSLGSDPKARGKLITENAGHVAFETVNGPSTVAKQLEPNAPPNGTRAVYDRTIDPVTGEEETHVVSLLPEDETPAADENASYVGASKDGEGIAFSIEGTLYLRVGNKATFEIGEKVEFAGVSEGGERIFYVAGGDLEAFDTSTEEVIEFSTSGNVTPVNVATGGIRAYFVAPSVLGGVNPQGDLPQVGKQNLYLSEEGAISFVATVTNRDAKGESLDDGLGLWTKVGRQVAKDPSRTNPDGSVLLFQSRAEITGYPASEFPQVYRFDSSEGRLQCISCIPTNTPATGGASLQTYTFDSLAPPPLSPNGFVPNLTPDGKRVFFESTEALVSTDTDEVRDVYEWEEGGVGSCDRAGGCVYLISSGQSERDDFLYAHSTSGDDVFFATEDALTDADTGGAVSIYDAKVGGGFPASTKPDPCVADGCRPNVTPTPTFPVPVAGGEGNVQSPKKPKTCPKGKRKVKKNGKVQCVKKHKQKKHKGGKAAKQRAGANRGAGK